MGNYGNLSALYRHSFALWERDGQSITDRHKHPMNIYTKFMYNYAKSICSCFTYYYIYSHTTYRVLYIIVLYRYIVRYSDIVLLCYDILWLYALMRLYAIIRTYRAIILCDTVGLWYYIIICVCDAILSYYTPIHSSDFLPPPFVWPWKGKYNLL